jgi:ubiquinone biosynthesis protein
MSILPTSSERRDPPVTDSGAPAAVRSPHELTKRERYREIIAVLARHGFGIVDDRMLKHEKAGQARAEHLRLACEELGTLFIKLGQVLSTRSDILAPAYRAELAKMQDDVPPLPTQLIAEVIEEDLGASPDEIFSRFDDTPLGSASIGQVHAARLTDGREVVVKVRKPGVDEVVRVDLEILASLVDEWLPHIPALVEHDAKGLLSEFGDTLRAELDYGREAANEELFRAIFKSERGFNIPDVLARYTRNRVLVEERMQGRRVSEVADLAAPRRGAISQRIVRFVVAPALVHGVFYGDPHPGNLLVEDDDSLSVIDFGKVGRLTPEQRRHVIDMFLAIARSDGRHLTDSLLDVTTQPHPVDRALVQSEVERMLELYANVSLGNLRIGDALGELLELVRRNRLQLPGNLVLLFKALAMCEGLLQAIDPQASFSGYLQPMIQKMILQEGKQELGRVRDSALEAIELGLELPERLGHVLAQIEQGNLQVWTRTQDADALMQRLERLVARLNATILAAACVVGLAIVMLVYRPHGWHTWIGVVFWVAVTAATIGAASALWRLRR